MLFIWFQDILMPFSAFILNIIAENEAAFISFFEMYNSSTFLRTFVLFNILIFEYHVIAGIRHMLMDFHLIAETLTASNTSAKITMVLFVMIALLTTLWVI